MAAVVVASSAAQGASSTTVVSMTVPSATFLDTSGCAPGVADVTDFGTVMPGSGRVTGSMGGAPCRVVFGSSNDTARLHAFQRDQHSVAMHGSPTGALDPQFGTSGVLEHTIPTGAFFAYGARYDRERIVVITDGSSAAASMDRRFLDGSPDLSFGDGTGRVAVGPGHGHDNTRYRDLIVDTAGRIVTVGADTGAPLDALMCRVTATGTMDTSITGGTGCMKLTAPTSTKTRFDSIVEHPAGGYLASGTMRPVSAHQAFVVRLRDDGTVDTTWGASGYWNQPATASSEFLATMAVQSDGRILVAANEDRTTRDAVIYRLRTDGTTDTTFGSGGSAAFDSGGSEHALKVEAGLDDRITFAWRNGSQLFVSRALAGGGVDATFNGGARYAAPVATYDDSEWSIGLTVGATGAALVSYTGSDLTATPWVHLRLRANGTPDTSFSADGVLEDGSTAGDADRIADQVELHDGTILVLGRTSTNLTRMLRFDTARIRQYDDAAGHDWSAADTDLFGACLQSSSGTTLDAGTWAADTFGAATCRDGDSDPWRAIARYPGDTAGGVQSTIARTSSSGQNAAEVLLRFGFRAAAATPSGQYLAPITFQVDAPG